MYRIRFPLLAPVLLATVLLATVLLALGPESAQAAFNPPGLDRDSQGYANQLTARFPAGESRDCLQSRDLCRGEVPLPIRCKLRPADKPQVITHYEGDPRRGSRPDARLIESFELDDQAEGILGNQAGLGSYFESDRRRLFPGHHGSQFGDRATDRFWPKTTFRWRATKPTLTTWRDGDPRPSP